MAGQSKKRSLTSSTGAMVWLTCAKAIGLGGRAKAGNVKSASCDACARDAVRAA